MEIKTNHQARPLLDWHELTAAERRDHDYLDTPDRQADASFVRYRGYAYLVGDFLCAEGLAEFRGWDGYQTESFFSGVLIALVHGGSYAIMGRYYT